MCGGGCTDGIDTEFKGTQVSGPKDPRQQRDHVLPRRGPAGFHVRRSARASSSSFKFTAKYLPSTTVHAAKGR